MDIYLDAIGGGGSFTFPSLPEEIAVSYGTNYLTYNIIAIGEAKVPRGTSCEKVSWDGTFYGRTRRSIPSMGTWQDPKACVSQLRHWLDSGTPLRLLVTETGINMDATIASLTCRETGGLGDIRYDISFIAYRELKMYTAAEMGITSYESKTRPRLEESSSSSGLPRSGGSYIVVEGDTLWDIARRTYGDGLKWEDIYNANQNLIEDVANGRGLSGSNRGWWIFPGTQIVLP